MSLHPHHQDPEPASELLSAIDELTQNTRANVQSRRGNNRIELNCHAEVTPANASQKGEFKIVGRCRDVSQSGCRMLMEQALMVGDVFLLQLTDAEFDFDPQFIRCTRCHLIREDLYECGVSFLNPVNLSSS